MLPRTVSRTALALTALLLGCRSGEPARDIATDSAPSCDTAAGGASVVTVTATDFAFEAPAEVPAGLTTFQLVNRGPSLHHIQLVKLEEGKTADDFMAALKAGGPPPRWVSWAGGPNPPEAGGTTSATVALEPGNYAMLFASFPPRTESPT